MSDVYDAEIERLVVMTFSELCECVPETTVGNSCLFKWCNEESEQEWSEDDDRDDVPSSGCLMMIRAKIPNVFAMRNEVIEPVLTAQIQCDERLPEYLCDIGNGNCGIVWDRLSIAMRREFLKPFAEWQRAMDATIRAGKAWHHEFAPGKDQPAEVKPPESVKVS